ncbi:MAG: MOSC domain-containing protein [Planctomycetota bacterium]
MTAKTMQELLRTNPQVGQVRWMAVRPTPRTEVELCQQIEMDTEQGLLGDHFRGKPGSKRQVTLIQFEHIEVVEKILGQSIDPSLLRRNIVVAGINLQSLKNQEFSIGEALLFGTGNCPPCSRMEENLGPGGYNAMRGHGGLTARVVRSGVVNLGDQVVAVNSIE